MTLLGIGESSMLGEPYDARISFIGLVAEELERSHPGARVHTELVARKGASLRALYPDALKALDQHPSAVVLLSGHNDFFGDVNPAAQCAKETRGAYELLRGSALFRFLYARLARQGVGTVPDPGERSLLDNKIVCGPQWDDILERYAAMASVLAHACQDAGIAAVLVFPAGNEAGFNPNRSVYAGPPEERVKFEANHRCGTAALLRGNLDEASRCLGKAAEIDPTFADVLYQRGRLSLARGEVETARDLFSRARQNDAFPWRALDEQRVALNTAAKRYEADFIDARSVISNASPSGLLDDGVFHDIHHPTLPAYMALARSVARALEKRGVVSNAKVSVPDPAPSDVLTKHGFSNGDVFDLLHSRIRWLDRVAGVTFDSSERLLHLYDHVIAARTLDEGFSELIAPPEFEAEVRRRLSAALSRYGATDALETLIARRTPLLARYPFLILSDPNPVHVGDVPSFARYGGGTITDGKTPDGQPLEVDGKRVEHGFGARTPADIAFRLDGQYTRLSISIAMSDGSRPDATAACSILGDRRTLADVPELRYSDAPRQLGAELQGVRELRLKCVAKGDRKTDEPKVVWLSPQLQAAAP